MTRRIVAITKKEFLHLIRDPRALILVLALPIVQLLLFAYAISFDVRNVPTALIDQDRTPASRAYLATYESSDFFDVVHVGMNLNQVDGWLGRGEAAIVVMVPPGFEAAVVSGEPAKVSVWLDGSEPNSAGVARAATKAINMRYSHEVVLDWAKRQGVGADPGGLEPRTRIWYNPEMRSAVFLIPGLMVVIIMLVTVQQTALTLVRERESHTLDQLLVSPLRRWEMLLGKLMPWTILAFLEMVAIVILARTLFHVPFTGDWSLLAVAGILFVFASLGLGLVISAAAPSLEVASIGSLLGSFLPAFLLSGFAFPLSAIPTALQWVSYVVPARYMVTVSRGAFLKSGSWSMHWPDVLALAVFALITLALSERISKAKEQ